MVPGGNLMVQFWQRYWFRGGIALTSTSILEEGFFLIYQQQAMTNM